MKRVYCKQEVCIACHLCEVYCLLQHSRSRDLVKAYNKESPRALPRTHVEERGEVSLSLQCRHCDDPPCVYACLTGALRKDIESGVVTVDRDKCIGCWTCVIACPFGAIIPDTGRGEIAKCDLCPDLEIPACVANCPNEALVCVDSERE